MQQIDAVPDDLKDIYRTMWEIEPFSIVDMASDRAPYIDQSQSMSLAVAVPSTPFLVSVPAASLHHTYTRTSLPPTR